MIEIQGDWADDSILFAEIPSLARVKSFQAQGHVSDLTWLSAGETLVFCASAQAYQLDVDSLEAVSLPFGAELCAAHPKLPLLVCFTSWRKESAKGRLFDHRSSERHALRRVRSRRCGGSSLERGRLKSLRHSERRNGLSLRAGIFLILCRIAREESGRNR